MATFNPVWENQIEIGTAYSNSSWTYSKLCEGIEEMTFSPNEQNQQYFFLCGKGFADNEVTGAAPEISCSGRRVVGNTAQDYVVENQFKLGNDRKTSVKITAEGYVITCDATIGDVTSFGGSTLDVNSFACTLRLDGEPTITAAGGGG